MLPAAFVTLEALPLGRNGKLDRAALPPPEASRPDLEQLYVAPRDPVEQRLAGIWADLLGVERVGVHDGFFELGGHSLLATRVVNHIQEAFGVELPLRLLFEQPTIAGLAEVLSGLGPQGPGALVPADVEAIPRLPRVLSQPDPADAGATPARRGVSIEVAHSFAELDAGAWDALQPDSLFTSSAWLRRVEGTLSPQSAYVLARDERGRPVAGLAAYLVQPGAYPLFDPPRLVVRPDLLAGLAAFQPERERRETEALARALAPELAGRYPVAVCVSPYSSAAGIAGDLRRQDVAAALLDALHQVARDREARSSALLNLGERQRQALAGELRDRGYLGAVLAARSTLAVRWRSFDAYLASLPGKRRLEVRRELHAFQRHGLRAEVVDGSALGGILQELIPLYASQQRKYGLDASIEAARGTLEWIRERFADVTRVVVVRDTDHALAFHLLYEVGGTIHSYLGGQTYEQRAHDGFAYFDAVFYEPVRLAISRGIRRIDYGTESYWAKVARGCALEPLTSFVDLGNDLRPELPRLLALLDRAQRVQLERLGERA
jgi:predicted N-acyltransferase